MPKTAAFILGRHGSLPENAAQHLSQFDLLVWGNRTHLETPGLIQAVRDLNRRSIHMMFYSWMNALDDTAFDALKATGAQGRKTWDYQFCFPLHFGNNRWLRDDTGKIVSMWPGCWTPDIQDPQVQELFVSTILANKPDLPYLGIMIDMAIDGAVGTPAQGLVNPTRATSVLWGLITALRVRMTLSGAGRAPIVGNGKCEHFGCLNGREWENFDPDRHSPDPALYRSPNVSIVHSSDDKGNKAAALAAAEAHGMYHHHTLSWDDATNWDRIPEWDQ